MRSVAQADDMANAVSFLVGPDAAYVHGVDLAGRRRPEQCA